MSEEIRIYVADLAAYNNGKVSGNNFMPGDENFRRQALLRLGG